MPSTRDPATPHANHGCTLDVAALLFDLDGVLADSTLAVEMVWRDFAARHGLDADGLMIGLHGRRMVDTLARALPGISSDELRIESERLEAGEVAGAGATRPQPGAVALTHRLGATWAIVTSGTRVVAQARIDALGLATPPVMVTADEVRRGKPDPEPYATAAARLGVPASACLVVEDAPAGIEAGNAAGALTVAVTTSHPARELDHADHLVGTVADLSAEPDRTGLHIRLACRRARHPVATGSEGHLHGPTSKS